MLANNDKESLQKMGQVRALLAKDAESLETFGTIFGATIVNRG